MTAVEISDWDDLDDINLSLSDDYVLVNDIDELSTGYISTGAGWTGIGSSEDSFTGTFNGQGHAISDLFINSNTTAYTGLFAYTEEATIQNLNLFNVDVYDSNGRTSALVGSSDETTIENCHVTGDVGTYTGSGSTTANGRCGGLIGWSDSSTIRDSSVIITFLPEGPFCGTFIGRLIGGTIENSYSESDLNVAPLRTTNDYNGGFVGLASHGSTIKKCYFRGDVNIRGERGGLFTSRIMTGSVVGIDNCYAIGDFSYSGINSLATGSGFTIVYSTATGAYIRKCYSSGTVSNSGLGTVYAGGAGVSGSDISDCFYDSTVESDAVSSFTGKTTAEMKDIDTYTDTDTVGLTTAWNINDLSLWKTDSGEITSSATGAPNWLRDTTKDWDTDEWIDYSVIIVDEGITRVVTSNISTYIYTTPVTWGQILTVGSFYVLTKLWFIDDGNDYPRLWFEYEAPEDTDKMFLVMM